MVANIIPTPRYFEVRFDHMQEQINDLKVGLKEGQKEIRDDMNKRFAQVDKRFEQVNTKLDTIIERMDTKIDAGLRETRSMSIRLFSFAMIFSAISMAGLLAKLSGIF